MLLQTKPMAAETNAKVEASKSGPPSSSKEAVPSLLLKAAAPPAENANKRDLPKNEAPAAPSQLSSQSAANAAGYGRSNGVSYGASKPVASMPPRVGLAKGAKTTNSLHSRAPNGAPAQGAAGSAAGARQGGLGRGVKIINRQGAPGVRRPGLHKNGFIKQQLHPHPQSPG